MICVICKTICSDLYSELASILSIFEVSFTVEEGVSHDGCVALQSEEAADEQTRQGPLVTLLSAKPTRRRVVGVDGVLAVVWNNQLQAISVTGGRVEGACALCALANIDKN